MYNEAMRWAVGIATLMLGCSSFDTVPVPDASAEDVMAPQNDVTVLPLDATIPGDGAVDADLLDGDGTCAMWPDGTACKSAPDACHTDGVCKGGVCEAPGTHVNGYNWKSGDDTALCCSGQPVHVTSNTNCGVCGIACNTGNGESCSALGGHYFCRNCISSNGCWSHCCSESFSPPSCAASDCVGDCSSTYCPAGTHCVSGFPNSSDYCAY
jgi:hypothetical protein